MSQAVPTKTRVEVEAVDISAASRGRPRIALLRTPTVWDVAWVTLMRLTGRLRCDRNDGHDEIVVDAAMAIRGGDCERAAAILAPTAVALPLHAAYLNLYGVICESRKQWKAAARFYGLAMSVDPAFEAARQNIRRIYELNTFGRTNQPASLGDIELRESHTTRAPRSERQMCDVGSAVPSQN